MSKLATAADEYARTELAKTNPCAVCRLRAHLPEDEQADLDKLILEVGEDGKRVWSGRALAALLTKVYGPDIDIRRGSIDNHRASGH